MKKNPKVTLIIPIYNAEKYLSETLNSVLNQIYKNLEVICVDDGSTDFSLKILEKYKKNDSRIKIIKQNNKFAGTARNNGLAHATGEYIMFLDADDLFDRNMVSYLVKKARKYDPDIIVFGYRRFVDYKGGKRPVKNQYRNNTFCSAREIKDSIFQITRSMPWDKFLKKDFVKKTGILYQETKVNNDIYFNRLLVTEASSILFCTKRLVNYRINNEDSLQGKLNLYPADFLRGNLAIYEGLNRNGTYDMYRRSFERMIVTDALAHLQAISSYASFTKIVKTAVELEYWKTLQIDKKSEIITNNAYKNTLNALIDGNVNDCLANLYVDTKKDSTSKNSIEYIIGHKLLSFLHLTY